MLVGLTLSQYSTAQGPQVTLPHGGKLRGISTVSQKTPLDIFVGIRYVKPPVGDLRFKRPEEFPAWEGELDATKIGKACLQKSITETMELTELYGEEDCLFMDVYVPGGVESANKKAVMVWIHGGGYTMGSGLGYPSGPLAVIGDVIVVTINYRIGPLGFLSSGQGTGNFGLWDQRAALIWVKKNIASFGGDPELVTIFGESAGGASVSAQTMGLLNDGLFKRAIQQSGTLMQPWGFFKSKAQLAQAEQNLRQAQGCGPDQCLYDCLRDVPVTELFQDIDLLENIWHPIADGEFIPNDVAETGCYGLSKRFDLMSGMNGEEGNSIMAFDMPMVIGKNLTDNSINLADVRKYLEFRCTSMVTKYSPELCAHFVIKTYNIDEEGLSGQDMVLRVRDFMSALTFDADIINNLQQHSSSEDTVTYAYYFTELFVPGKDIMPVPEFLVSSANHGYDLPFVFGAPFMSDEGEPELWREMSHVETMLGGFITEADQKYRELSQIMITAWTNFAKTGNPNEPNKLPAEWPKFTGESGQFLQLKTADVRSIDTPNKEKNDLVNSHLFSARRRMIPLDLPDVKDTSKDGSKGHDEL